MSLESMSRESMSRRVESSPRATVRGSRFEPGRFFWIFGFFGNFLAIFLPPGDSTTRRLDDSRPSVHIHLGCVRRPALDPRREVPAGAVRPSGEKKKIREIVDFFVRIRAEVIRNERRTVCARRDVRLEVLRRSVDIKTVVACVRARAPSAAGRRSNRDVVTRRNRELRCDVRKCIASRRA